MFVKHMFPGGTHPHEGVNGKAVNSGNAIAEKIGEEPMPDVSWLDVGEAQAVFASDETTQAVSAKANADKRLVALYVTHSDAS